jgi:hypothetical protein
MRNRRLVLWASLLLIVVLVLAGCAPRSGAGTSAATAPEDELVIDLPAIVIDINADGSASVGNVPVSQLGAMAGVDLSTLSVPAEWVNFFVQGNIQHLQVNNHSGGLMLLVNGEAIPSLAWDGESLTATADTLAVFGLAIPMLEKVLPLVQKLGLGVIVRFPVSGDAIPLFVEGESSAAMEAQTAQDEFLAAVGSPPKINLPIFYAADGSYSVGDLTDTEWTALTGVPWYALRLNPSLLDGLKGAGVESLGISTDTEGIQILVNDRALPRLTWGDGQLVHLLDVADQIGLWNMLAPGMNLGDILTTVHSLLPVVQTTDFSLTVHFADAGMAAAR